MNPRRVLGLFIVLAISTMLAAQCGAPAEPQVIEKEVIVTKEVEVEKIITQEIEKVVEKEVEVQVVVTATPESAPAPMTYAPGEGGTLRVHQENPPKLFIPIITAGREAEYVFELIFDRVTRVDEEGKIVPDMAESWELSEDELTWTFKLRDDIKWHDGEPFTAKDVEFTMYAYLDPILGQWWAANFVSISGAEAYNSGEADTIEGIKVIDDYTIAFTTDVLNAAFPALFVDAKIIPEHIWKDVPRDEESWAERARQEDGVIGTGPFKFIQYQTDEFIELERFEDYFLGTPKIGKIFIQFAPVDTGVAMLESGEIDMVFEVPYEDAERLKDVPGLTIHEVPNAKWVWWIRYNLHDDNPRDTREFLQNAEFRQALTAAFDRQAYVDAILLGHGQVIDTHCWSIPWTVPEDQELTPYDPEAAKAKLEELGWDFDNDRLKIIVYPSNKARNEIPEIFQSYLAEIGVKADVTMMDLARARELLYGDHDYDICIGGWLQGADPSLWAINLTCDGGRGTDGYCNPAVDELFDQGVQTFDFAERQEIYQELCSLIQQDMPKTPVVLPNIVAIHNDRLFNFVLAPERGLGARFVDVHTWAVADEF